MFITEGWWCFLSSQQYQTSPDQILILYSSNFVPLVLTELISPLRKKLYLYVLKNRNGRAHRGSVFHSHQLFKVKTWPKWSWPSATSPSLNATSNVWTTTNHALNELDVSARNRYRTEQKKLGLICLKTQVFKRYLKGSMRHISLLSSPTDRPLEWTWWGNRKQVCG